MQLFDAPDPARRVLISGTYNGHPLNVAAATATIERLRENNGEVYRRLEQLGARLQAGLEKLHAKKGLKAVVSRIGSALCTYFCDSVPSELARIGCESRL